MVGSDGKWKEQHGKWLGQERKWLWQDGKSLGQDTLHVGGATVGMKSQGGSVKYKKNVWYLADPPSQARKP